MFDEPEKSPLAKHVAIVYCIRICNASVVGFQYSFFYLQLSIFNFQLSIFYFLFSI